MKKQDNQIVIHNTSKHTKLIRFGHGKEQSNLRLWFCHHCTKVFEKGETILTKRSGKKTRKRYCLDCAELVNLITKRRTSD